MKNKFGFSIRESDKEAIEVVNKIYDHAIKNGISFSYIVTQALKEVAPKLLGGKND